MKQILKVILNLTGLAVVISAAPRKFYLIPLSKSWSDARAYCQTNHNDLAIIDSSTDLARLQNEPQSKYTGSVWIGMSLSPSHFLWSYKNESLGSFNKWLSGWPRQNSGNQNCTWIYAWSWYNFPCGNQRGFICYDDSKTGTDRYIYYSTAMTWFAAQSFCRQNHTDLASVRNETEDSAVNGKLHGETWIGLFREPWKWVDRTDVTTFPWVPGQPDNALSYENCGLMINYQVEDNQCASLYPFICYREVTKQQQIIRMKVQSDQNVNNAAVMEAIWEMIQQKLQERGVDQNITMKWRKQPDGLTFYRLK